MRMRGFVLAAVAGCAAVVACGDQSGGSGSEGDGGAGGVVESGFADLPSSGEEQSGRDGEGDGDASGFEATSGDGDGTSGGGTGDGDTGGAGDLGLDEVETRSGSRIVAQFWRVGAERDLANMRDKELDTVCGFAETSDGRLRCVPYAEPTEAGVRVMFTDESCSQPIGTLGETECAMSRYARFSMALEANGPCGGGYVRAFEVGEEEAMPETLYQLNYDGDCAPVVASEGTAWELNELTPEELVEGEIEIIERGDELGVRMVVTEDGFRHPLGAWDLARDHECSSMAIGPTKRAGEQTQVCLGQLAYSTETGVYGFADDECSVPSAAVTHCDPVEYALYYGTSEGCQNIRLHAVGDELKREDVHQLSSGTCEAGGGEYYQEFFTLGDEVSPSEVPEAELALRSDARVQPLSLRNQDTWIYSSGGWFDTEFGTRCSPWPIGDAIYCLPVDTIYFSTASLFADSDCSVPVHSQARRDCGAWGDPILMGFYAEPDACGGQDSFESLYEAKPFEGELLYQFVDETTCAETEIYPDSEYFVRGQKLDPAEVLVELALDP